MPLIVRGAVFVEGLNSNCLRLRIRKATTPVTITAIPPTTPPTIAGTEIGVEAAEVVGVVLVVTEVGLVEVAPFVDAAMVV